VTMLHSMLEKLVDTDDSVWHQALRKGNWHACSAHGSLQQRISMPPSLDMYALRLAGIAKRRDHLDAKRKQLLRFRALK
jgi:hypothetical protein